MVELMDDQARSEIIEAIRRAEAMTSGEIRVHIRKKCGQDVLKQAQKIFKKLNMHRTAQKNGVLLFIALDSRCFAVIGDAGIHRNVGDAFWNKTRDELGEAFSQGRFKEGIISAVQNIGEKLKMFFPVRSGDKNELPDTLTQD